MRTPFALPGLFAIAFAAAIAALPVDSRAAVPDRDLHPIAANENVVAAGRLEGGTLRVELVARRGLWYPDGPAHLGLPIESFGEIGKPLEIPGPLVRAPLGTRVVATLRNELGHPLTVRGLGAPSSHGSSQLVIPRGATRRVSFVLDRSGTFSYVGFDRGETIDGRIFDDAELSGAIVVDSPGKPRVDHVFVLGLYAPVRTKKGAPAFLYLLETINGRSFPATEHLAYDRGRTVRWAVVNASSMLHPMHLHGFYFKVDRSDAYDEVTHPFRPGDAEELAWTADRPGNWMFHCHIDDHITRHAPLRAMLLGKDDPHYNVDTRFHLADQPMGGMVIAVDVMPKAGDRAAAPPASPRRLALAVDSHDVAGAPFGLTADTYRLTDGARTVASTGSLGPPIVLARGEPVAIAVTNHMHESTSIHWHGIALEDSYYDGGAGMGMAMTAGARMAPAIEPGGTFVAHFVPPTAGSFMYHSHMDDGWQLAGGLVGPLIVLPPGQRFDPQIDHVVMLSESFANVGGNPLAIAGSLSPAPIAATVGVPQRLRLMDLTLGGQDLVVSLSDGTRVQTWTPIAKDGRDLPQRLQVPNPAVHALTIGETRDFRFTPTAPGTYVLAVYDHADGGVLAASQRIVVTAAQTAAVRTP